MKLKLFNIVVIFFWGAFVVASESLNWLIDLPREIRLIEAEKIDLQRDFSIVNNQKTENEIKYQVEEIYKQVVKEGGFLRSRDIGFQKVRLLAILDQNNNISDLMAELVHPVLYKTFVQRLITS